MLNYKTVKISENLYFITLNPPISGFKNFIGVFLYKGKKNFIVDTGPSVTANSLIFALKELNIFYLDYILLTHIHIDHAGGIGELADAFPAAKIICHKKGIPHLVDPARLWEGTVKTLGDIGHAYGPFKPVCQSRFTDAEKFSSKHIYSIITPGHAAHHVSFFSDNYLFAGETGGVFLRINPELFYLRPATPPKFFFKTALKSIDSLIKIEPLNICYGHFGFTENATNLLKMHKQQLLLWEDIIGSEIKKNEDIDFYNHCLHSLLKKDVLLKGFSSFTEDIKKRESNFLLNSIKGFAGYLKQ